MQNSRILLHRFLNVTGGFVGATGDYSTGASQVIMPYAVRSIEVYEQQTSWENILSDSKYVVIWGADPLSTLHSLDFKRRRRWLQNAASYSFPVARIADALLHSEKP